MPLSALLFLAPLSFAETKVSGEVTVREGGKSVSVDFGNEGRTRIREF